MPQGSMNDEVMQQFQREQAAKYNQQQLQARLSQFKPIPAQVFPSTTQFLSVIHDDQYGGAHQYAIRNSKGFNSDTKQPEDGDGYTFINFVFKPGDNPMVEGVQTEQLLLMILDRHGKLNAKYADKQERYNKFVAGITMALEACEERVQERMNKGVMGKLVATPQEGIPVGDGIVALGTPVTEPFPNTPES